MRTLTLLPLLAACEPDGPTSADVDDSYQQGYAQGKEDTESAFSQRVADLEAALAALQDDVSAIDGAYVTDADLGGYLTAKDLGGYLTTDALDGYATEGWVDGQGYLTSSSLSGYATEGWVGSQGYATESWVDGQGYSTDTVDAALTDLVSYLSVDTSTDSVAFVGANVFVQSGQGTSSPSSPNGLGNLIVGYDEDSSDDKSGSHNLVVGPYHSYPGVSSVIGGYDNEAGADSYWGAVFGYDNLIDEQCATITGGYTNEATGFAASVVGGFVNEATGNAATVLGGNYNDSLGNSAVVVGGGANTASGDYSMVSGGLGSTASGTYSMVSGGYYNTASSSYAVEP